MRYILSARMLITGFSTNITIATYTYFVESAYRDIHYKNKSLLHLQYWEYTLYHRMLRNWVHKTSWNWCNSVHRHYRIEHRHRSLVENIWRYSIGYRMQIRHRVNSRNKSERTQRNRCCWGWYRRRRKLRRWRYSSCNFLTYWYGHTVCIWHQSTFDGMVWIWCVPSDAHTICTDSVLKLRVSELHGLASLQVNEVLSASWKAEKKSNTIRNR